MRNFKLMPRVPVAHVPPRVSVLTAMHKDRTSSINLTKGLLKSVELQADVSRIVVFQRLDGPLIHRTRLSDSKEL